MENPMIKLEHAKSQAESMCCMTCHFADFSCGQHYGECRRHAPTPRTYSSDDLPEDEDGDHEYPNLHDVVEWPLVHFTNWCGEYDEAEKERVGAIIGRIESEEKMNERMKEFLMKMEMSKGEEK